MGKQEYDKFKSLVKEWLDNHPEEYAKFVEEMNEKNQKGFQKVFMLAMKLAPQYKKATRGRMGNDTTTDFTDLESILSNSNLAEKIVNEFHCPNKKSIIHAMLAWLYYGRSYECMVEQGEELIKDTSVSRIQKWMISLLVKFIIKRSISTGMRSKEEWIIFRKQQNAIENNSLVEWSMEEEKTAHDYKEAEEPTLEETTPKAAGRKADIRTLPELLIENKEMFIERINTRLKTRATEIDIARLYIALVEYRFMRQCPIKTFRNALQNQYEDVNIVNERGIQKAYKNLITPYGSSKKLMKDIGEDLIAIDELKAFLSE